jgi:hypothetical protein
MPIAINGTGTITGISVGGLPDAIITGAELDGAQTGSAPIYGARAWVNFNGTGTVAIRASGNVSSITDNATGNYFINFSTALPDGNYAVGSSFQRTDETGQFLNIGFNNQTAGFQVEAFRAASNTNTAVLFDPVTISLVVMR